MKWISIDETFPTETQECIGYFTGIELGQFIYIFRIFYPSELIEMNEIVLTHWMPLTKPSEGQV